MSGAGVGETLNAAFAALSAASSGLGDAGLSSRLTEVQHFLEIRDDKTFTECQDRRCRALNGLGLWKADKVALTTVPLYKTSDDLDKWMESAWTCNLLCQGGAALQHWVHETNHLDNGLQPPPNVLHTAVHKFTPRNADTATLEAMVERGELPGLYRGLRREVWASATKSSCWSRCRSRSRARPRTSGSTRRRL